jgi:hypothetical protein
MTWAVRVGGVANISMTLNGNGDRNVRNVASDKGSIAENRISKQRIASIRPSVRLFMRID